MPTILDSINQIPILQRQFANEIAEDDPLDRQFAEELMNFTSIYYLDLIAHAALHEIKEGSFVIYTPSIAKYNEMTDQNSWSDVYLRFQSIGMLYTIWGLFEQFLWRLHGNSPSGEPNEVEKIHKKILDSCKFGRKRTKEILAIFKGIRRTRNSLHNGGIYQQGTVPYKFLVCGAEYELSPGAETTPIRITDLVTELWTHYQELKAGSSDQ